MPELLPDTRRALLHRLAVAQAEGRVPSLVGAVVRDGRAEPVWSGSRGRVPGHGPDTDVQYRIGSITKTFVAVLVWRLVEQRRLGLADPVGRHLGPACPPAAAGLTVAQLLAHTSGLASETPGPWWERTPGHLRPELADILGQDPARHPAGRRFHYSNPGYALLGAVVERLHGGQPWYEVLRREILAPLGMRRTTPRPEAPYADGFAVHPWADLIRPEVVQDDTGLMAPAGQLWSTAGDLCRWAAFLAQGDGDCGSDRAEAAGGSGGAGDGDGDGSGGGTRGVLAARTLAELRRPASPGGEHGLGVQRMGPGLTGHTGSMPGFLAAVCVSDEESVGAVVLANATDGLAPGALAADLVRIVTEREPRIPAPWRPASDPDPGLLALTGPWHWGPAPFVLRLGAGRDLELVPLSGGGRAARFTPAADGSGSWTGLDGYYAGETLTAVRGPDGAVSHLDIGSFVFTRGPYQPAGPVPGGTPGEGWTAR